MKTFILGVGAQKAGTTWLFKQIKNHPNFQMGVKKEMRVFSGYEPKNPNKLEERRVRAAKVIKSLREDHEKYFEYFAKLASPNEISHVGEITPIYCDLEESKFEFIRDNLEKKNFEKKIVFLIRDPYKRVLSQFRFNLKRSFFPSMTSKERDSKIKENPNLIADNFKEEKIIQELRKSSKQEKFRKRTRYEIIIPKLLKVFKKEEVFIDFFEDMFNDGFRDRFIKFSNLKDLSMDFDTPSNISPKLNPLPSEVKSEIINFYKDTYDYISSLYPEKSSILWKDSLSYLK